MITRRHVIRRSVLLRKPSALQHALRWASNSPRSATRTLNASVKSTRHQSPVKRSSPRTRQQDAEPPRAPSSPFGFPSKLAAGVLGGIAVLAGFYTFSILKSLSVESSQSRGLDVDPDAPSVKTYDHIAPYFDSQVNSNEFWLGISHHRKQLVGQASGDVLEVGVGTGRNHNYYKLKGCRSITFLDASENMVAIASAKWNQRRALPEWKETAPDGRRRVNFRVLGAEDTVVPPTLIGESNSRGFTTILSTFTLCSMPRPAETLAHLCTLLSRDPAGQSRVLLLEHGKSDYDWINKLLDNSAPAHAHQYGCWWNRDIGAIAAEAADKTGMEITSLQRKHFGTTWIIELRPNPRSSAQLSTASAAAEAEASADSHPMEAVESGTSTKKWWQLW